MDDSCDDRRRSSVDDILSDHSGKKKGIISKKKLSLASVQETDTQSSPSDSGLKSKQRESLPSQQSQSVETVASSKESIASSQPPEGKATTSDDSTMKSH